MSQIRVLASALTLSCLILLLAGCGTRSTRAFDPRLTEPCQYVEFPSPVTARTLSIALAEQWELTRACDDRMTILREGLQE